MNIGVDVRALMGGRISGVESYIVSALRSLFAVDSQNQYYLFSSGIRDRAQQHVNFQGKNVHYVHLKRSNKLLNLSLLLFAKPDISKLLGVDIDVVWLPNLNFFRFNPTVTNILTIHDLSFLHSREFYSLKRRWWHKLINVSELVDKADHILAVSANTKRDIMRFFPVSEDKISVIYPGVSVTKISEEQAELSVRSLNLPKKYWLYVGTLEPRKNIDSIVKAFDRLHREDKSYNLVIAGSLGWIYRPLLAKIRRRPYIHYVGYVSGQTKDGLYKLSQGLIWPSFYEGFGFPPLEATFHHKPVITSHKTSLPEIMKNQPLYVDPYNVSDLYQLIKNIEQDRDLALKLRQQSHHFKIPNWHDHALAVLKLLNKLQK